jgi:sugar/nucleoside kinase (ribokinase family)
MTANFDVTIAGEIKLDLILYGLPQQMPVNRKLLTTDFVATLGSSSAILTNNFCTLGLRVGFITRIGGDEFGHVNGCYL